MTKQNVLTISIDDASMARLVAFADRVCPETLYARRNLSAVVRAAIEAGITALELDAKIGGKDE